MVMRGWYRHMCEIDLSLFVSCLVWLFSFLRLAYTNRRSARAASYTSPAVTVKSWGAFCIRQCKWRNGENNRTLILTLSLTLNLTLKLTVKALRHLHCAEYRQPSWGESWWYIAGDNVIWSENRLLYGECCLQHVIQTVSMDATSNKPASVMEPVQLATRITPAPSCATVCTTLHCVLIANDKW